MTTTTQQQPLVYQTKWFKKTSAAVAVVGTLWATSLYHYPAVHPAVPETQDSYIVEVTNKQPQQSTDTTQESSVLISAIVDWASEYNKTVDQNLLKKYVTVVFAESSKQQVDPLLTLAVIAVESRFDFMATSSHGAKGLMQIIPKYHKDKIALAQIYDPIANIRAGTRIIREYLTLHNDDVKRALLNYNGALGLPGATFHSKVLTTRAKLRKFIETKIAEDTKPPVVEDLKPQMAVGYKFNYKTSNPYRKLEI